jgi:hypothetical protein
MLEWLLAPALAIAAIGLQFAIDVPHHAMLEREDDPPAASPSPPVDKPLEPPRPREAAYTERLRAAWVDQPIADEPRDPRFAPAHEAVLRAVVRKAEAAVSPTNEPNAAKVEARCHTIRCDLQVCAPVKLSDGIAERLPKFVIGRATLWHELREVQADPARDVGPCRRWIVDFAVESPNPKRLRIKG